MSSQRAPDIYVALLLPQGYGYPLWLPGPLENLPNDYFRDGTQIGDLGYLADDGGFVYLFNVGKDASDPVNLRRTPPDFVPLPGIHESENTQLRPYRHQDGVTFQGTSKEKKSIGGEISAEAPIAPVAPGVGVGLEFTSSSTQAAYLVLPDGGKQSKYEYPGLLEQYASTHAHSWYKYFNGQGRQIRNGMLYLVTGWNKCRSWANACHSHSAESKAASLKLMVSGGGANISGATLHYSWAVEADSTVHRGCYPHKPPAPNSPETTENQTIFLHGYSISVRQDPSSLRVILGIKNPTKGSQVDEIKSSKRPHIESWIPYAAKQNKGTDSGTAQGLGAGMKRRTARPLNFDDSEVEGSLYDNAPESLEGEPETGVLSMNIPYEHKTMQSYTLVQQLPGRGKIVNPSALINEYILDNYLDATVALTHDDFKWTGVEDNIKNPLNVMELAAYAIDKDLVSINESETTPNAWVAKRRDTNISAGAFTRKADTTYFKKTLPKVALFAFTETGQGDSSIEVPKQRSYTGPRPVIPFSLADTPCNVLGFQGVLDQLNAILGKSGMSHGLHIILEGFVERKDDFGTVYAHLRQVWNEYDPHNELCRREEKYVEHRQKALVGNQIVDPNLPPRRVWDLCSNRVVPFWVIQKKFHDMEARPTPISHAWVDEKDRVDVWTPINGREWPVPIPRDADLNLIRMEMLNLGAEYTWLDVLCLRQGGGPREDLRKEEWRLDVPTIGAVYEEALHVVTYLNGLGRPLRLKDGDLDSDRSWFRRAWTLQEAEYNWIRIAGDTPDGLMHAKPIDDKGNYETPLLTRFRKQLDSVKRDRHDIFALLADMQRRVSTNPVDRVAGLAFPLIPRVIPAYDESQTLEDAWTALVNAMYPDMRACFLFVYPGVGLGCKKWRPTWDQVMTEPLPEDKLMAASVEHDNETDEDWYEGGCIEEGCVLGLDAGSEEGCDRCGELVIDGVPQTFQIRATHQIPIPEDTYTLIGGGSYWAVGRRLSDRRFEKVSVIMMDGDVNEPMQKLEDLNLVAPSRIFLI